MLIRTVSIALAAVLVTAVTVMGGCLVQAPDGDQPVAATLEELETHGRLICNPCDPNTELSEAIIHEAALLAQSLYSQAVTRSAFCVDLEPGMECNIYFSTPDSWCGPVGINCHTTSAAGSRIRCTDLGPAGGCD